MTIAIDKRTGKPCGQFIAYVSPEIDFYDGTVKPSQVWQVMLLARDGYVTVRRDSVRLEEVED